VVDGGRAFNMSANYFTCTLGQAVNHQRGKAYRSINEFLEHKARSDPDLPVLGFYEVADKTLVQLKARVLTFSDVLQGTVKAASTLSEQIVAEKGQAVGLLCPSSVEFLFSWLALIWLGHPALLIAPQCSPSAIASLSQSCGVRYLLTDRTYGDLAKKAEEQASALGERLMARDLPVAEAEMLESTHEDHSVLHLHPTAVEETDIAYLHHTSGTSSGVPKPIPQSHRGAIGVLPSLDGATEASFTTTPLYHGGIADLFRAWTSNAMIWLFPGKHLPITAANVCKCLDMTFASKTPDIRYFSSVPYVLQLMAEDDTGLRHLQQMKIVGVGGAALPGEIGDRLVENGVNLVSRFGSAECGFLMSSHRDYRSDKDWQYLRADGAGGSLVFEPRDEGLSELIIGRNWPHMAKRNRDDGSYATADLFAAHPTIPNAWRYHSRADSQLTLITGKKFDPAPLEDAIRAAASTILDDVLIFGTGKPYPGVLLFRSASASDMSDEELARQFFGLVDKMNQGSQHHARIPKNMLIPMPHLDRPLEKSSKGTILRRAVEERFASDIQAAYEAALPGGNMSAQVPDSDIEDAIYDLVVKMTGENSAREQDGEALTVDTDLFSYGVDSVASIRIRHALSRLVPGAPTLPLSIVQDAGTISRLSKLVLQLRAGELPNHSRLLDRSEADNQQLMLDLVREYSVFKDKHSGAQISVSASTQQTQPAGDGLHVLLTGPTGSLGANILHQLLNNPSIAKIHLLVRGATATASRERVLKALTRRQLLVPAYFDTKVQIYRCKLSDPDLGLCHDDYTTLSESVDVILHLAWSVNFLLPLRSFAQTHLASLQNLINFALSQRSKRTAPRFVFCSSVAAVSNYSATQTSTSTIPERTLGDPTVTGLTGYAQSKWVAEQICTRAHETTPLKHRISIARVGQLSGGTETGVWSMTEAYPLLLSSMQATGVLPDLDAARKAQGVREGEVLGWLPADIAARAFVGDILVAGTQTHTDSKHSQPEQTVDEGPMIHHVLNPSTKTTWSSLLTWLSKREKFRTVDVNEWLSSLDALSAQASRDSNDKDNRQAHPATKLLDFWRGAYGSVSRTEDMQENGEAGGDGSQYDMTHTRLSMPSLSGLDNVVDEAYVLRLWTWIKDNV
jgi:thioester reductase-like protein